MTLEIRSMAAGEVSKRREGETAEEKETTTNVKRRKLEEEVETRMILSSCVQGTNRGGIVSDASEASLVMVQRQDSPAVEEQCHQSPSVECDLLESARSSSVSCCSSSYRSGGFDQTETSCIYDHFNKSRDPEEEDSVNVGSAAMEMKEVESCRVKEQKKRCETVKEAEIEDFFEVAEKDVRNKMLECSSKYNFDFEKEEPLDGRYKWLKFNP